MLQYPNIDPVAISFGPMKVHWYGIMYLLGFAMAWLLGAWRSMRPNSGWTREQVTDMIFYCMFGVIIGGRVGYVLFYAFDRFIENPFFALEIWRGGMSFHGGFLGVAVAMWIFALKNKKTFFAVTDFLAPLVPLGLGAGRLGNFINAELWGRPTDLPWAMVFPGGGNIGRHPSQLYEFFLEGIVLFAILWWFSRKQRPAGATSALFIIFYGLFRFLVEWVREPDPQKGFIAFDWLTMGMVLSIPMVLVGVVIFHRAYKRKTFLFIRR